MDDEIRQSLEQILRTFDVHYRLLMDIQARLTHTDETVEELAANVRQVETETMNLAAKLMYVQRDIRQVADGELKS